EQWEATFDAITDGVCIIDERGVVDRCNDAADALLGRTVSGVHEYEFYEAFPPPGESPESVIANVITAGEPLQYDVAFDDRWYSVRLDPVPPREDESPSVVAVIADITERRAADAERMRLLANTERARKEAEISRLEAEAARREAEQASRAKSEFLAV